MKVPSAVACLTLLSPIVLGAPSLNLWKDQSPIQIDGDIPVPGDNPLTYCAAPSSNILTIERVDLSPNPPLPGKTLTIRASGIFSKPVVQGAKVLLQVKYGLIRLINQTADLCEQIENVDLHCPLEKGKMEFVKDIELPKEIPPGRYTVTADVLTKDDEKITCLEAAVTFDIRR